MISVLLFACGYEYFAQDSAKEALQSNEQTTVSFEKDWIHFAPTEEAFEIGVVFYPGGKVEAEAYAPIIRKISDAGISSYIVYVTGGLAILDQNAALGVFDTEPLEKWIVSGHSLGGVAAAKVSSDERVVGLSLWASYPASGNDLSTSAIAVQSIVGTDDGVLNWEKWNEAKENLPSSTQWMEIEGGNHSQFGDYGFQDGDNVASISAEEQWLQTASGILDMINNIP